MHTFHQVHVNGLFSFIQQIHIVYNFVPQNAKAHIFWNLTVKEFAKFTSTPCSQWSSLLAVDPAFFSTPFAGDKQFSWTTHSPKDLNDIMWCSNGKVRRVLTPFFAFTRNENVFRRIWSIFPSVTSNTAKGKNNLISRDNLIRSKFTSCLLLIFSHQNWHRERNKNCLHVISMWHLSSGFLLKKIYIEEGASGDVQISLQWTWMLFFAPRADCCQWFSISGCAFSKTNLEIDTCWALRYWFGWVFSVCSEKVHFSSGRHTELLNSGFFSQHSLFLMWEKATKRMSSIEIFCVLLAHLIFCWEMNLSHSELFNVGHKPSEGLWFLLWDVVWWWWAVVSSWLEMWSLSSLLCQERTGQFKQKMQCRSNKNSRLSEMWWTRIFGFIFCLVLLKIQVLTCNWNRYWVGHWHWDGNIMDVVGRRFGLRMGHWNRFWSWSWDWHRLWFWFGLLIAVMRIRSGHVTRSVVVVNVRLAVSIVTTHTSSPNVDVAQVSWTKAPQHLEYKPQVEAGVPMCVKNCQCNSGKSDAFFIKHEYPQANSFQALIPRKKCPQRSGLTDMRHPLLFCANHRIPGTDIRRTNNPDLFRCEASCTYQRTHGKFLQSQHTCDSCVWMLHRKLKGKDFVNDSVKTECGMRIRKPFHLRTPQCSNPCVGFHLGANPSKQRLSWNHMAWFDLLSKFWNRSTWTSGARVPWANQSQLPKKEDFFVSISRAPRAPRALDHISHFHQRAGWRYFNWKRIPAGVTPWPQTDSKATVTWLQLFLRRRHVFVRNLFWKLAWWCHTTLEDCHHLVSIQGKKKSSSNSKVSGQENPLWKEGRCTAIDFVKRLCLVLLVSCHSEPDFESWLLQPRSLEQWMLSRLISQAHLVVVLVALLHGWTIAPM